MAAEREEVVMDAETGQIEHALHVLRARLLAFVARGHPFDGSARATASGLGSALRSIFPLGRKGMASSVTTCCGSMYFGQALAQAAVEFSQVDASRSAMG